VNDSRLNFGFGQPACKSSSKLVVSELFI